MKANSILRMASVTRPIWRYKTPVLYRVSKWIVTSLCPKGKPGRSQQLVAPFDGGLIQVDTSSSIEYHLLFRGCHESAVTDIILRSVKSGDTCIDVGANVGAHALVMAKLAGPYGRVIALEPHPRLCDRLRQNIDLNRYESLQVVEAALSDEDGEASFYGFDDMAFQQGISSLLPDDEAKQEMKVRTITYDSLQKEVDVEGCHFIKIDVEGYEAVVLKELMPLIEAHRPTLIFEYRKKHWDKFGASIDDVVEKLRELGYQLKSIKRFDVQALEGPIPESCEILCEA